MQGIRYTMDSFNSIYAWVKGRNVYGTGNQHWKTEF